MRSCMERAEKLARHIVTLPPVAVRMMKEFVVRFGDLPTDQAWHVQNLMNNLLIQVTTDGEEGRQAFNEKRPPELHRRAAPPRRGVGGTVGRRCRAARRGVSERGVLSAPSSQRARSAQCIDLVMRQIEHVAQDCVGVRAEPRRGTGAPAETGAPRHAWQKAAVVRFPEPAFAQVTACNELARSSRAKQPEYRHAATGLPHVSTSCPRNHAASASSIAARLTHAFAESQACHRAQRRNHGAQTAAIPRRRGRRR